MTRTTRGASVFAGVFSMLLAAPVLADSHGPTAEPAAARASDCPLGADLHTRINAMLAARDDVDYRGTLLVEYGGDREFVAVNSVAGQHAGQSALVRLNRSPGAAPELVTLRSGVTDAGACALHDFYAFDLEPGQVVAGRETYRLTVRPRDTLRLGYVMDVDRLVHVPLKMVTATPDGHVLERFEFASIELSDEGSPVPPTPSSSGAGFEFAGLPPGFSVIGQGRSPVDHAVLSDGLASVSVFVEPQPGNLVDGEGMVLRGSTLTYTRGTAGGRLITVLGEIPVTTARLLADAVRRTPGE